MFTPGHTVDVSVCPLFTANNIANSQKWANPYCLRIDTMFSFLILNVIIKGKKKLNSKLS